MHDPFDRRISLGAVDLVFGRVRSDGKLRTRIKKYLDHFLKKHGYYFHAPFLWVDLIYLHGTKNDLKVQFQKVGKKYGDLPITIELDMEMLQWADQNNLLLLHDIFMIGALEALIQVGKKYKLPTEILAEERQKYGDIPNSIEECEKYPQKSASELKEELGLDLVINRCRSCGAIKRTPEARQCLKCGEFTDPNIE